MKNLSIPTVNRLGHTLSYLGRLKYDLILGDYLKGTLTLSKIEVNDLLNYYIKLEEYEICQKIVNGSNNIINT